jgi:lipopolysaccharide transport system ATP-binding protein
MSTLAISVENLSKQYRIGQAERYRTLRDSIMETVYAPFRGLAGLTRGNQHHKKDNEDNRFIWALKDVSFCINNGEAVGIIGRNGAGKSTLLKVISRITEPTRGAIDLYGRVGSLLEVGTGFHPELTGRENIFLNGAILGMRRTETERKFDEIVAFSEIEQFIDTPVKYYSTGMYMRLAFSVAAHLEPEILLVDEVLAVGDDAFQKKCLGKMDDISRQGRTVLFVSHNLGAIEHLCSRVLMLQKGTMLADGMPADVIKEYLASLSGPEQAARREFAPRENRKAWITSMELINPTNPANTDVVMAAPITIGVGIKCKASIGRPVLLIQIVSLNGQVAFSAYTHESAGVVPNLIDEGVIYCHIPAHPLTPGKYFVNVILGELGQRIDEQDGALSFDVQPSDIYKTGKPPVPEVNGVCWTSHTWEFSWDKGEHFARS